MPPQATARSPLAGCLILLLALGMLLFLIGFSAWMPFRQAAEIEKFTRDAPAPLAVEEIEGKEALVTSLVERLEAFRADLTSEEADAAARIELTVEELNLAIARFPQVEELRGSFRIREITAEAMIIDICYQLNGRPRLTKEGEEGWITSDHRYLIGTLHARPQLAKRELSIKVDRLEVPGAEIPQGFLDHFSSLRIFERYLKDPVLGPAMGKLTRAELEPGKLVLARVPGEHAPETVTDEQFAGGTQRFMTGLGIAASLFLAFVAAMVFVALRKQRRKEREKNGTAAE